MTTIDISEETLARESSGLLRTLLKDRTTNKSIVWATHSYELLGKGFGAHDRITPSRVTGDYANLIQPRSEKSKYEQKDRTKVRAEVFTPTWLVKKQVDTVDQEYQDLDLEAYLQLKWLEITCGEAPYMVSRYDTVTGQALALEERVGFLDRKLQRLSQEVHEEKAWFQGAVTAYQNSYGYEFQGDSLLLARENLFASFIDCYQAKFTQEPSSSQKMTIARIISYNVLQMDGLTYTSPYSQQAGDTVQLSLFEEIAEQPSQSQKAQIKDWKTNELIDFERLSKGETPMKFDVVIGNPPYQEEIEGANTQARPIYNLFMEESYKIGDKAVLITPARFLANTGATPKKWNKKMLEDEHLKICFYELKSGNVFPGTDIKGGVVITYHDNTSFFEPIDTFISSPLLDLAYRIVKKSGYLNQTLDQIMYGADSHKLTDVMFEEHPELLSRTDESHRKAVSSMIFERYPEVFFDERPDSNEEYCQIYGRIKNNRTVKYIKSTYLKEHPNLRFYKILVPESNGSGALGEVLSTPLIGEPLIGYSQTFVSIGQFQTKEEAEACLKYIKTHFARGFLGIKKITQHNPPSTWQYVPLFDFASSSVIDWSQSVAEIDAQLYALFNFPQEVIDFFETNIRPMD